LRMFENRVLRRILDTGGRVYQETGEDCIMRSFIVCTISRYYCGDQIKEHEMGGTCSTDEKDEKTHTIFWLENLKGRDHLQDLGVDGKIILE